MKIRSNELNDSKLYLTNLLNVVCHNIENIEETRSTLSPQLQALSHKLDEVYDTFNKGFSIEIQILNHLANTVFKKSSDMRTVIKAFIAYNSADPDSFCIPGDTFIKSYGKKREE